MTVYDAVVVGSGPNGLAAAITLARAGRSVVVLEAAGSIGGGARTMELTEPGFRHDLASAIHPLGRASPVFADLDLESYGLRWIDPPAAVAHPLDGGDAGIVWSDLDRTVEDLGPDGLSYRRFYEPWLDRFQELIEVAFTPLLARPPHPLVALRLGAASVVPAATTARRRFRGTTPRAIFAGHAAHAVLPLTAPFTATFGILLGTTAHAVGWGFPEGGAQSLSDALARVLEGSGGEIRTDHRVDTLDDLPPARAVILALTPRQVERIAGDHFSHRYRRRLRSFRYGPGAWKVDFALSEPIPWTHPDVGSAGTVHVGGDLEEIVAAEAVVAAGGHPERPFVLLAQHTPFDPSRAPSGRHTAWAYCHVPNGSTVDQTDAIERQIERFAPGFRDTIIARHPSSPAELERQNANLVGGDIGGGSYAGTQLFFRPGFQVDPYRTADPRIFLGSASTSPGAGVHGVAGARAAQRALATTLR